MTTTTETVAIECSCKVCEKNAASLGRSLPLRAEVPVAVRDTIAFDKQGRHGVIYSLHHPTFGPMNARLGTAI